MAAIASFRIVEMANRTTLSADALFDVMRAALAVNGEDTLEAMDGIGDDEMDEDYFSGDEEEDTLPTTTATSNSTTGSVSVEVMRRVRESIDVLRHASRLSIDASCPRSSLIGTQSDKRGSISSLTLGGEFRFDDEMNAESRVLRSFGGGSLAAVSLEASFHGLLDTLRMDNSSTANTREGIFQNFPTACAMKANEQLESVERELSHLRALHGVMNVTNTSSPEIQSHKGKNRHSMLNRSHSERLDVAALTELSAELRAERDLWALLASLSMLGDGIGLAPKMGPTVENDFSNAVNAEIEKLSASEDLSVFLDQAFTVDGGLQRGYIICDWLEACAADRVQRGCSVVPRRQMAGHGGHGGHGGSLHPDQQLKSDGRLVSLDGDAQFDQTALLHTVFALLRAGALAEAHAQAVEQKSFWLAAAIGGLDFHRFRRIGESGIGGITAASVGATPAMIAEGNQKQPVWLQAAWDYAEKLKATNATGETDISASELEKTIYAALACHWSVLSASSKLESWQDRLWAVTRCLFQRDTQTVIHKARRHKAKHSRFHVGCEDDVIRAESEWLATMTAPLRNLSLSRPMEVVDSVFPPSGKTLKDRLTRLQAAVIGGPAAVSAYISAEVPSLLSGNEDSSSGAEVLLRVLTHVGLWLQHAPSSCQPLAAAFGCLTTDVPNDNGTIAMYSTATNVAQVGKGLSSIVSRYVDYLTETRQVPLVARYCAHLPRELRVHKYATLLSALQSDALETELLQGRPAVPPPGNRVHSFADGTAVMALVYAEPYLLADLLAIFRAVVESAEKEDPLQVPTAVSGALLGGTRSRRQELLRTCVSRSLGHGEANGTVRSTMSKEALASTRTSAVNGSATRLSTASATTNRNSINSVTPGRGDFENRVRFKFVRDFAASSEPTGAQTATVGWRDQNNILGRHPIKMLSATEDISRADWNRLESLHWWCAYPEHSQQTLTSSIRLLRRSILRGLAKVPKATASIAAQKIGGDCFFLGSSPMETDDVNDDAFMVDKEDVLVGLPGCSLSVLRAASKEFNFSLLPTAGARIRDEGKAAIKNGRIPDALRLSIFSGPAISNQFSTTSSTRSVTTSEAALWVAQQKLWSAEASSLLWLLKADTVVAQYESWQRVGTGRRGSLTRGGNSIDVDGVVESLIELLTFTADSSIESISPKDGLRGGLRRSAKAVLSYVSWWGILLSERITSARNAGISSGLALSDILQLKTLVDKASSAVLKVTSTVSSMHIVGNDDEIISLKKEVINKLEGLSSTLKNTLTSISSKSTSNTASVQAAAELVDVLVVVKEVCTELDSLAQGVSEESGVVAAIVTSAVKTLVEICTSQGTNTEAAGSSSEAAAWYGRVLKIATILSPESEQNALSVLLPPSEVKAVLAAMSVAAQRMLVLTPEALLGATL